MIKSMTGYGKAEAVLDHKKITVEIRSLNSKQLDLTVKVPAVYRQSEYEIRNRTGKQLQRGKIDAYVSYEITGDSVPVNIDRKTFTAYFGQIREIAAENGRATGVMAGKTLDSFDFIHSSRRAMAGD